MCSHRCQVRLAFIQTVDKFDAKGKYGISISLASRNLYFETSDANDRDAWCAAICAGLEQAKSSAPVPPSL